MCHGEGPQPAEFSIFDSGNLKVYSYVNQALPSGQRLSSRAKVSDRPYTAAMRFCQSVAGCVLRGWADGGGVLEAFGNRFRYTAVAAGYPDWCSQHAESAGRVYAGARRIKVPVA